MDRNCYVDLRQPYLDLKLNFLKGCGYETFKGKDVKKEQKQYAKVDRETEEEVEEAPVPLDTHVSKKNHSIFSKAEVYINNKQN